jgi:hypothetical protein
MDLIKNYRAVLESVSNRVKMIGGSVADIKK